MSNPLFNVLGGNRNTGGVSDLIKQIQDFRANFKGDPRQKVQELLNSGQMTQEQFNQLSQEANRLMQLLK